jgi:uracil-DNA glycosylase
MSTENKLPDLEKSWLSALETEFAKPYFLNLKHFLREEKKQFTIYPEGKNIFSALNHTPVNKVKVVILGQDPYHGAGQANGLCFSVNRGVKPPPSLQNMFKELQADLGLMPPQNGDLTPWADQGVLLLNATLTVRESAAGSHQNKGWEVFTDAIIDVLNVQNRGIVFLLWGRFAQQKAARISNPKHVLLKAAHPSPFSAYNGFMGCKHFSKPNQILLEMGEKEIDWTLN